MALTVSYTQVGRGVKEESGYKYTAFRLNFGDGVLTYGTGIAIDKRKLGCPNLLRAFYVIGQVDGYNYVFDKVNAVLHVYQVPAAAALGSAAPMVELAAGATPAAVVLYIEAVGW